MEVTLEVKDLEGLNPDQKEAHLLILSWVTLWKGYQEHTLTTDRAKFGALRRKVVRKFVWNYLLTWGLELVSKSWWTNYGPEPNCIGGALLTGVNHQESVVQNVLSAKPTTI